MSNNSLSATPINPMAFLRALLPPLIIWGAVVLLGARSGQAGVACLTPMAWLLALWSGLQYASLTYDPAGKPSLLAPILIGILLGLGFGVLFAVGSAQMMANEVAADELAKAQNLTVMMFAGSVVACPLLCLFTARLTYRRFTRGQ